MTRPCLNPACLTLIAALAFFTGRTAIAVQPVAVDGGSTVCTSIPAETGSVLDEDVASAEDIQSFHKAISSLRAELDALCKQDKTANKRLKDRAKSIVFEMSAGAAEPAAYWRDGRLVVEFYGGSFDGRSFRQHVKKVLLGQKIPIND